MKPLRLRPMHCPLLATLALCVACAGDEPAADREAAVPATPNLFQAFVPEPSPGEADGRAAPDAPDSPPAPSYQELPRVAYGARLGMTREEAAAELGELTCHDNPAGFEVCTGSRVPEDGVEKLEIYLHDGRVLSVAYETAPPPDVWAYLDTLMSRFGEPSLSGLSEHDKRGRLHEVYGWKDRESLYAVRFIWREQEPEPRQLIGTAVTIWDRGAYGRWEQDRPRPPKATGEDVPARST